MIVFPETLPVASETSAGYSSILQLPGVLVDRQPLPGVVPTSASPLPAKNVGVPSDERAPA